MHATQKIKIVDIYIIDAVKVEQQWQTMVSSSGGIISEVGGLFSLPPTAEIRDAVCAWRAFGAQDQKLLLHTYQKPAKIESSDINTCFFSQRSTAGF